MWFEDCSSVFDSDLNVIVALGDVVIPTPEIRVDLGHRWLLYFVVKAKGTASRAAALERGAWGVNIAIIYIS